MDFALNFKARNSRSFLLLRGVCRLLSCRVGVYVSCGINMGWMCIVSFSAACDLVYLVSWVCGLRVVSYFVVFVIAVTLLVFI